MESAGPVVEPLRRNLEGIPAREAAGVRDVDFEARRAVQEMAVPAWLRDDGGIVTPGAVAILADSTLGTAVMSTVSEGRGMVTSHLHLELMAAVPVDQPVLRCEGRQVWLEGRFGVGEGEIETGDGRPVARATIGSVILDGRARFERTTKSPVPSRHRRYARAHQLITGSPAHEALGTAIMSADSSGIRVLVTASAQLANSGGGLHGGVGVLIGERVLDLALRHALAGEPTMRPVELRAAFLRPITADGGVVECRGGIAHLGRRLAAARGELRDHEGRPAVLVDATYISEEDPSS